jgi:hypothetical protein
MRTIPNNPASHRICGTVTPVRRGFLTVTATLAPCVCVCYITTSAAWHWQDLKLHRHGDGPDIPSWESTNRVRARFSILHGRQCGAAVGGDQPAVLWASAEWDTVRRDSRPALERALCRRRRQAALAPDAVGPRECARKVRGERLAAFP